MADARCLRRLSRRLKSEVEDVSVRSRTARTAAALFFAALAGAITVRFWQFGVDDSYIAYRIAENIAGGQGWVYNTGERINGSTSPLWTFVLAAGASFGRVEPVAHAATGFCLAALGFLWWRLTSRWLGARVALRGGLLLLTHLLVLLSIGMETPLYLAFGLLSILAFNSGHSVGLGLALGGLCLARPDGVLLACVLLCLALARDRAFPWKAGLTMAAPLIAWSVFSWWYFGSFFPNTLAAKMAQGRSGLASLWMGPISWLPLFAKGALFWLYNLHDKLALALMFPCALAGLLLLRSWRPSTTVLVVWGALHLLAYSILKVPHYHWYYGPVLLAFLALLLRGFRGILEAAWRRSRFLGATVVLLGLAVPCSQVMRAYSGSRSLPEPRHAVYKQIALWVRENTRPDFSVAAAEIGVIGYFAERRIIDMLGLIHREGPAAIRAGRVDWWLKRYRPDLAVAHHPPWPYEAALAKSAEYRVIRSFSHPSCGSVDLYERSGAGPPPLRERGR
jgi:hypothetical protein